MRIDGIKLNDNRSTNFICLAYMINFISSKYKRVTL